MIPRVRKTKRSTVLYWPHAHLFLFGSGLFRGFHFRYRAKTGLWRHHRVAVFDPGRTPPRGRGVWTWEWCSWLTEKAMSPQNQRIGLKAFVRLKIGLGGA